VTSEQEQLEDLLVVTDSHGSDGEPRARRIKPGVLPGISVNFLLLVLGAAFLLPLIWLVDASLNPHASAALSGPAWSITNYRAALAAGAGGAIKNSLYLAVVSTIVATAVSTLAAFALSRRRVPFKASLLLVILFLTGLPVTLLLIPIFEIFVHLGWVDSPFYTSLVLAATSVPFAIWLLKNFIDQVPRELEEAAAIEGASELRILWRIVIPLAMPGILVASILTFINSWGAFLIPLVLDANPNDQPGALGIYQFMSANGTVHFGPLAAYAILFSAPVVVLYLICSRWLNGGFAFAGGVKG
jgi:multiple sugar transport system permease protein